LEKFRGGVISGLLTAVAGALAELKAQAAFCKVVGSYPRAA